MFGEVGGDRFFANLFVKAMYWIDLALRKFHRLMVMLGIGKANLGDVINDGRYCSLVNSLKHVCLVSSYWSQHWQTQDQG